MRNNNRLAQCQPGDATLTEILALLRRSFAYMDARIDPPSSMHVLGLTEINTQCKTGEVWAIGTPARACVFLTPHPDCLYVGKLAVDHTQRGQGLARRLIGLALSRAQALDLPYLELHARIELIENHQLFAKMGFIETSQAAHDGYDRPTYIVMRCPVAKGK